MAKLINRYALFDAIRNITYNSKDADAFFEEVLEVITEQPTTTEAEIREKAHQDFYDKVLNFEDYIEPITEIDGVQLYSGRDITRMVRQVAEQLKEE